MSIEQKNNALEIARSLDGDTAGPWIRPPAG